MINPVAPATSTTPSSRDQGQAKRRPRDSDEQRALARDLADTLIEKLGQ